MKLKTVEVNGVTYAVLDSAGKPVYVHDDGKEVGFDAPQAVSKITALNREAQGHREAKEAAETKLQAFTGIDDPEAAKTALTTVKNLSDKKLVDAGEVDKIKQAAIQATEARFEPVVKERDTLKGDLHKALIGGSFSRSKFIADKLVIPADLVESQFGKAFELKDGKIVAKYPDGNPIYSRSRPGEHADFDEALETLVENYPHKASILKGNAGGGGNAPHSKDIPAGRTMKTSEFNALPAKDRAAKMAEKGFTLVD